MPCHTEFCIVSSGVCGRLIIRHKAVYAELCVRYSTRITHASLRSRLIGQRARVCNEMILLPRRTQMTSSHGSCLNSSGEEKSSDTHMRVTAFSIPPEKTQTEPSCCRVKCESGDSPNSPTQTKPSGLQRTKPP